ncbi:MAG: HAMP domain-containing histidine kinase [Clostridia bacterium]|nr:HAMP domain-containing histidine kinase [Clostridia bacterium]
MKRGLFKKYFFGAGIIVIAGFFITVVLLFVTYNNHLSKQKSIEIRNACESVAGYLEQENASSDTAARSAHFIMFNSSRAINCDIFVTNSSGEITVCCCGQWHDNGVCEHIGNTIDLDTLKTLSSGGEVFGTAGFYPSPRYLAAVAVGSGTEVSGYVFSSASPESIKALMTESFKIYLLISVVPLLIMFAALYFMTYRINKPLKLMSEAAKAMAKGDFSKRIPVTGDDEIGELAASFNQMINSLSRLEETRKSFIANVSHEMRTPMTTIGGFIDGIIDGTIEPEKQSYYLNIVSNEIKRLSRMVQSMLSIARLESSEFSLKKDTFDLREQILNIVISQEQRIEEKNIIIEGLDTLPPVSLNADKDLIYQAVYNLVDNAIKFVDEGGRISFALWLDENGVGFSVTNSGAGIPRGDLPFVFDRFYKLDKSRAANKTSMGLGLYIVKTIIKNHGGTIRVESKQDEFTRFSFVLPSGK